MPLFILGILCWCIAVLINDDRITIEPALPDVLNFDMMFPGVSKGWWNHCRIGSCCDQQYTRGDSDRLLPGELVGIPDIVDAVWAYVTTTYPETDDLYNVLEDALGDMPADEL